jgi:2-methoxy-6-polyprenyl-1,4-benzoquinol methylase
MHARFRYLVESIRKFPRQDQLVQRMEAAGFRMCSYENMTFGVVAIHSGFKL